MVKNIAIMDSVYELLARNKRKNESFSQELLRLIDKKKSIMEFAGACKMSDKEVADMKEVIRAMKQNSVQHVLQKVT